jgi:hypothetical protein
MNDATTTSPLLRTAPGVAYSRIDGVPGRFFRCEAYRCSLSVSSCADRWRQAQSATGNDADRFEKCRSCPVGAAHNGVEQVHRSPLFGKPICPRTRVWTNRMIHDRISVAMRNRELEFLKRRDCKGHVPQFRFDPRRLAVIVDGVRVEVRDALTADLTEMVVAVLRTVPGRLVFTRAGTGAPAISTIELAERYRPKAEAPKMGTLRQRARAQKSVPVRQPHAVEAPAVAAE